MVHSDTSSFNASAKDSFLHFLNLESREKNKSFPLPATPETPITLFFVNFSYFQKLSQTHQRQFRMWLFLCGLASILCLTKLIRLFFSTFRKKYNLQTNSFHLFHELMYQRKNRCFLLFFLFTLLLEQLLHRQSSL